MRHPDLIPMSDEIDALRAEVERLTAERDDAVSNALLDRMKVEQFKNELFDAKVLIDYKSARIAELEAALRELIAGPLDKPSDYALPLVRDCIRALLGEKP